MFASFDRCPKFQSAKVNFGNYVVPSSMAYIFETSIQISLEGNIKSGEGHHGSNEILVSEKRFYFRLIT